jgi:PTH2 family peptidyl-tRNA hydrolase
MKQAIVLNSGLKMGKGKAAAQCAHASLQAFIFAGDRQKALWLGTGAKKIVLKVANEKELLSLYSQAKKKRVVCALIHDAGHTQVPAGSLTTLAIGPADDDVVDELTGDLKLF